MFDFFYTGPKPNIFPHEQPATSIEDARKKARTKFFWLVPGDQDLQKIDFTWLPVKWEEQQVHHLQFYSEWNEFAITFAPTEDLPLVEHWHDRLYLKQPPIDVITYESDSVVDAIQSHTFSGPYALFKHVSVTNPIPDSISNIRHKYKPVHVLSKSGSVLSVPREAKGQIRTQVYDYPFIVSHSDRYVTDKDLDIVYISNGEEDAERWFHHLTNVAQNQNIHRVSNVNGRSEAYKAAATISTTPWFFAVFAKLEVDTKFDWHWQPDYMQEPKHYIFSALNPVNDLIYGHQAILAYNKKLTLETDKHGLDFTLSKAHEVVNMMSGVAHFNVDPWTTWRTAFRECIKLIAANDIDSQERLHVWSTVAHGKNSEWSLKGAADATEYFNLVKGNMPDLLKTFEWAFLRSYFTSKYN